LDTRYWMLVIPVPHPRIEVRGKLQQEFTGDNRF